jgi:hypothetical protein
MIIVETDPGRKLVRATMSGLLSLAEVKIFGEEEQKAVRSMGLASGEFFLLVDAIGETVQTQEVALAFGELVSNSALKAERIAIVRSGVLASMQSRRIAGSRSNYEVFGSVADAEAWLFPDPAE